MSLRGLYGDRAPVQQRDGQGRKRCPRCKEWWPESDYHSRRASKDGLHVWCKPCTLGQKYGLSGAEVREALKRPVCGMCGRDDPRMVWHLDHDARTGEYRAVLCKRCNTFLGHIEKDPGLAARALQYLYEHALG